MQLSILSTADWDSAVWTNKQHLTTRLLQGGHSVNYIESLGLRRPRLELTDLQRIARRLNTRRPLPSAQVRRGLQPHLVSPRIVPFHGVVGVDLVNEFLLARQTRICFTDQALWTFSPLTLGLEKHFSTVIYHSVDLLHTFPGVPRDYLLAKERELISVARVCIASSRPIQKHLIDQGATEVLLWENVADIESFTEAAAETAQTRTPRAVFAGTLTTAKVDVEILLAVAEAGIDLQIAGPRGIDGTDSDAWDKLLAHDAVTYHGNLQREDLARLLSSATVGIIPYLLNDYTDGVFPMKVYEYLAAGLAVVCTALPSLAQEQTVTIADTFDFVGAVQARIAVPAPGEVALRGKIAAAHSWTRRMLDVDALLRSVAGT